MTIFLIISLIVVAVFLILGKLSICKIFKKEQPQPMENKKEKGE